MGPRRMFGAAAVLAVLIGLAGCACPDNSEQLAAIDGQLVALEAGTAQLIGRTFNRLDEEYERHLDARHALLLDRLKASGLDGLEARAEIESRIDGMRRTFAENLEADRKEASTLLVSIQRCRQALATVQGSEAAAGHVQETAPETILNLLVLRGVLSPEEAAALRPLWNADAPRPTIDSKGNIVWPQPTTP